MAPSLGRLRHGQLTLMGAKDLEANTHGIPGVLEIGGAGESLVRGLAIQRPQVVSNAATIRSLFLESLCDEFCRIVGEGCVRVRRRIEFPREGSDKGAGLRARIARRERHA